MKKSKFNQLFYCLIIASFCLSASAEPKVEYVSTGLKDQQKVSAIVGIEDKMADCVQGIDEVTVDDVIYESGGWKITAIVVKDKLRNKRQNTYNLELDNVYNKLSNAQRYDLETLLKKNMVLILTTQVCGQAAIFSIADIYSKSSVRKH